MRAGCIVTPESIARIEALADAEMEAFRGDREAALVIAISLYEREMPAGTNLKEVALHYGF